MWRLFGFILALRSECFDKKIPFQTFTEKMNTCVVLNLEYGSNLQVLFTDPLDPTTDFQMLHKPKKSKTDQEDTNEVDLEIYKEEIMQFVRWKGMLRQNLEKTFDLIWGQCSSGLQMTVKGLTSYYDKAKTLDTVWLIQELKKATSGIDDRENAYVSMHNALVNLYHMKQGAQETNDHYVAWFKTNVNAVELTGGGHLFVSQLLMYVTSKSIDNYPFSE